MNDLRAPSFIARSEMSMFPPEPTGSLPKEVGMLTKIDKLDVSDNSLSGSIPETIGECISLEYLNLQGNFFRGIIPSSLVSLRGLRYLDLSRNQLSGSIPSVLQNISLLEYLNVSFNMLDGEVPKEGVFGNASRLAVVGNNKLCGGISHLHLPPSPVKHMKLATHHNHRLIAVIVSVVVFLLTMLLIISIYLIRKRNKKPSSNSPTIDQLPTVSYQDLYQATDGFSSRNLIGLGGFGSVYKGSLMSEDKIIAVKVLNLEKKGAHKSFITECNALKNIRHRNLVKILTCCSSIDYKGQEFKALVFEYMKNGSLEQWLHPREENGEHPRPLDLNQRLNTIIDVASALHYLHRECEQLILHCDLKPSNALIDEDIVAHVSDFGIARLVSAIVGTSNRYTSTIGIKGSIGYAPPEYGMGSEVSTCGDMYSFGILILEMFTGRRPIDETFEDSQNLHKFVSISFPNNLMKILDPHLLPRDAEAAIEDGNSDNLIPSVEECLVSLFKIGLVCSMESPEERMNIVDVTRELNIIRKILDPHLVSRDAKVALQDGNGADLNPTVEECLVSLFRIGLICSMESPKERMNIADVTRELSIIKKAFLSVAAILRNQTDHLALLRFKESISSDPYKSLESWNSSIHFCNWHGITCSPMHERVIGLNLEGHQLHGSLSPHVGNLTLLKNLNLGNNSFYGKIPQELGDIPQAICRLKNLTLLAVGENNLSGTPPSCVYNITSLTTLSMTENSFHGPLPVNMFRTLPNIQRSKSRKAQGFNLSKFGTQQFSLPGEVGMLKNIDKQDVSENHLSGDIPRAIGECLSLEYLLLQGNSFNGTIPSSLASLKGEVPTRGVFGNITHVEIIENKKLCGGISQLHLPPCPIKELHQGTDGFSPTNLIGSGNFGSVYKANLESEDHVVAIKVLNLQKKGAHKSFIVEYYKGQEFKALVFDYMKNGSLEQWLHPEILNEENPTTLSLGQRLNIIIDVADALHYLHLECQQLVLHCDLKSSNVLLDIDMVAHVSDFGIARLVLSIGGSSQKDTSSIGIKGTVGYAPPEYGMGSEVSTCGDMYSFGILVLEMLTGRRPTDEVFEEGQNLHNFVAISFPDDLMKILDPRLVSRDIEVAIQEGNHVTGELSKIKKAFFTAKYNGNNVLLFIEILGVHAHN
ncbi:hypothetical protein TSUD_235650 [Trifolium subterraneum]|nr:hypothetical protein TSUD_235650 [Trifolium subterraneum]